MNVDELTEELVENGIWIGDIFCESFCLPIFTLAKGKGVLEELMEEAAKEFPSILEPLMHERDKFLAW